MKRDEGKKKERKGEIKLFLLNLSQMKCKILKTNEL